MCISHCEKTLVQTQNSLEGLFMFSGMGTPWHLPGGAGDGRRGEGCLGFLPGLIASAI